MKRTRIISALLTVVMTVSIFASNIMAAVPSADTTGINQFVTRMYNVCLDRNPDQNGLNAWSGVLADKKATGSSVAYGFIYSSEFQNKNCSNEDYVRYMYSAFFGRQPDNAGFNAWVNVLNNGTSREEVFAGFANSTEFSNLCKSYGVVRGYYMQGQNVDQVANVNLFVERLYNVVLDRSCDDGGMQGWTTQLVTHQNSGAEAAYGFVFSPELLDKALCNSCYLDVLYGAFMGRKADATGKNAWLNILASGTSREEVFNGFAGSQEFGNICASYGIDAGSISLSGEGTHGGGVCSVCGHFDTPSDGSSNSTAIVYADSSSIPRTGITQLPYNDKHEASCRVSVNPLDYTYEVIPLVDGMNTYFYIKTENPDPWSFAFVDKESIYYTDNYYPYYIRPITYLFPDVVYENEYTGRVHGGYIAVAMHPKSGDMHMIGQVPGLIGYTDGGKLDLVVAKTYLFGEDYSYEQDGQTWHHPAQVNISFEDTDVVYDVGKLDDIVDYLIHKYGVNGADLFANLDSIQSGLRTVAIYPRTVKDDTSNTGLYPSLAVSPYVELGLNVHADIYPSLNNPDFLEDLYPFNLNSYSFPLVMQNVAQRLQPDCVISSGGQHQLFRITYNGETKTYGGQGAYPTQGSLYLSQIEKLFTFTGQGGDLALGSNLPAMREKFIETNGIASANMTAITGSVSYSTIKEVVGPNGAWLRVGTEGTSYSSANVKYAYYSYSYGSIENIWVDGRYINRNNYYEDMTFAASMNLSIKPSIYYNNSVYDYSADHDCWILSNYFNYDFSTLSADKILTRAQVNAMNVDRNHSTPPAHGYIYDGSAAPGTPF